MFSLDRSHREHQLPFHDGVLHFLGDWDGVHDISRVAVDLVIEVVYIVFPDHSLQALLVEGG